MSANAVEAILEISPTSDDTRPVAFEAGVEIPTNCTSGTCGACMVTLMLGEVPLPNPLPPGLDDFLVEEGARLGCIGLPTGDVDIDIRPPL